MYRLLIFLPYFHTLLSLFLSHFGPIIFQAVSPHYPPHLHHHTMSSHQRPSSTAVLLAPSFIPLLVTLSPSPPSISGGHYISCPVTLTDLMRRVCVWVCACVLPYGCCVVHCWLSLLVCLCKQLTITVLSAQEDEKEEDQEEEQGFTWCRQWDTSSHLSPL